MLDVLGLLLQAWEEEVELHGWLIMKSLRLTGPTVFRVLDQLEVAGWITASWEVLPGGQQRPRRRYYRLTGAGVEAAREKLTAAAPAPPLQLRPQPGFTAMAQPASAG